MKPIEELTNWQFIKRMFDEPKVQPRIKGSIPEMIEQLEYRHAYYQRKNTHMVQVLRIMRTASNSPAQKITYLRQLGYTPSAAEELLKTDSWKSYSPRKTRNNMIYIKRKIASLKEQAD